MSPEPVTTALVVYDRWAVEDPVLDCAIWIIDIHNFKLMRGILMPFTEEEITDLFTYHAPNAEQQVRYEQIRQAARVFAMAIIFNTSPCADQTAAIRHLRICVMEANASIALEKPQ